jgi:UDP-N-acetylmuramate dehydrogenase
MNLLDGHILERVPLNDKNTYCIGGQARYFGIPGDERELSTMIAWADDAGLPVFLLGKGSNVLISDEGWSGLVMQLPASAIAAPPVWHENNIEVGGGIALNNVVKEVADHGYRGMEELAGIPGTVGGAVMMNAGAYSSCIADTLTAVTCFIRKTYRTVTMQAADLLLGYRTSAIKLSGDIVLTARFSFIKTDEPSVIAAHRKKILELRKSKQPLEYPNCGSVFKRPPGTYAGTLIEQCGLKGVRCGDAEVSQKHANFIINTGAARADDVRHLICTVQRKVYEACGILLEPEVIFVGTFEEELYVPPAGK